MATTGELDWQTLARTLADGFESLLREVDQLSIREHDLDAKLGIARQEYLRLSSNPALTVEEHAEREAITQKLMVSDDRQAREVSTDQKLHLPHRLEQIEGISKAFQAYKSVKTRGLKDDSLARCPVSGQQVRPGDMEQDFTTPGRKSGNLGCPFATMALLANGVPTPPHDNMAEDPIKAELNAERQSISSRDAPSATGAGSRCPIRYLDQHSPEEVAKYFEEHKHEIPRSHEICVKRYQRNSESIRELDSKYGNLVSMIQGLGVKHQQYLPGKEGEIDVDKVTSSNGDVSRWADGISRRSEHVDPGIQSPLFEADMEGEEIRTSHFQRPLREIRVGESPSRPWGISVPLAPEQADSPPPVPVKGPKYESQPRPPLNTNNAQGAPPETKAGMAKCPFGHGKAEQIKAATHEPAPKSASDAQSSRAPMVFNGPVFFGYSAEQAIKMMNAMPHDT